MKKLAIIRDSCPFGLSPVPGVCKFAGESVDQMTAIESLDPNMDPKEREKIINNNKEIFNKSSDRKPCKYAAHIFPNKSSVDCDWGDTAAGVGSPTFTGSQYYEQLFNGVGFNGLYAVPPMSGINDPFYMRNIYYGLSEYASNRQDRKKNLIKRTMTLYSLGFVVNAGRKEDALKKYPEFKNEIDFFVSNDPSGNLKYLNWELKVLKSGKALSPEINDVISLFHKFNQHLTKKDINQWQVQEFTELRNKLFELKEERSQYIGKRQEDIQKRYIMEDACDAPIVYEDDVFVVRHIKNKAASVHYGMGTEWCIRLKTHHYYEDYDMNNVVFFFILNKHSDKSDILYKIAVSIERDGQNNFIKTQYTDIMDSTHDVNVISSYLGDSAPKIFSVINSIAATQPRSAIAKLSTGDASEEDSIKIYNMYKNNEDYDIKNKICKLLFNNKKTAKSVIDEIIDKGYLDYNALSYAIRGKNTSPHILSKYYEVIKGNIAKDPDSDWRYELKQIVSNPNTPPEILNDIFSNIDPKDIMTSFSVVDGLFKNEKLPLDLLEKIIKNINELRIPSSMYYDIFSRDDLTPQIISKIYENIKNKLDIVGMTDIVKLIAKYPSTPPEILDKLVEIDNYYIYDDLIENNNLSANNLQKIYDKMFGFNWVDKAIKDGKIDTARYLLKKDGVLRKVLDGLLNNPNSPKDVINGATDILKKLSLE